MAPQSGWIRAARQGDRLVMTAGGAWVIGAARELDRTLRGVETDGARSVVLDLADIAALDTAGAWLVLRTRRRLEAAGRSVEVTNLGDAFAPLYHQVAESDAVPPLPSTLPPRYGFSDFLARIGRVTVSLLELAASLLGFVGRVCIVGVRTMRHPSRLRLSALVTHMEHTGIDALPIVGMLSFLVGVVFAFQGADQLRRLGADIYTVNLLGVVVLRELGVLITAIILAGRSGSAFTAQIGTMMVNEEIDAMTILGLDPIETLVLPRLLAMLLTLPLVAFYANVMALVGGAMMSWQALDISIPTFLRQLHSSIPGWTFWVGVLKAPTFAGIIAVTGCYEGLRVTRSAESVGRLTTRSVVESIFLIIAADALFTVIFAYLNI